MKVDWAIFEEEDDAGERSYTLCNSIESDPPNWYAIGRIDYEGDAMRLVKALEALWVPLNSD